MRRIGRWAVAGLVVMVSAVSFAEDAPSDLIRKQLEAGEFAPALEVAGAIQDPQQRTRMLQQIAAAQRAVGEFGAARNTAAIIPDPRERARERTTTVRERNLRGGGTGADFGPLIDLITTTIDPDTWDEVGGAGSVSQYDTGVTVDPYGQLRLVSKDELTGRLSARGVTARDADLNEDMARQSGLRMISLPRLEQAVAGRLAEGQSVPETMRRLAGLTRIQYVFLYPDENEIVIAGPAEGWRYDDLGRPVGRETAQPTFDLDDLVNLLRTFSPKGEKIFGCSINPREANLKSVKEFAEASAAAGPLPPGGTKKWLNELHTRMGLQDVVVYGVPHDSRIARVLVEADYRMKLIGIDKLNPGREIPSYFDILPKLGATRGGKMDALRWWLTMKYGSIDRSPDRTCFEIQGSSVLCQSEHQYVTAQGKHVASGSTEAANQMFAANFTKHYTDLAQRDPVFADLQNVFDLGMAAAICGSEGLPQRAGWDLGVFAVDGAYSPATVTAPRVVESVMNHRTYNGKDIVVQVAGGVTGDILSVVKDPKVRKESAALMSVGSRARVAGIPAGRWWWDAKPLE